MTARVQLLAPEDAVALRKRLRAFVAERLEAFKVPIKVTATTDDLTNRRFKQVRRAGSRAAP